MYQEEVKPNPAILKKYILTGENSPEWLVQLYPRPSYTSVTEFLRFREPSVVAVYTPTGRTFLENGKRSWEYCYEGIRIL